ncbi:hypothetical protein NA78x_001749 [Anatilimnocola sp. NA78]|uniref:hypothetical protein n=1 Tax=Anatilimnocola sp. NA78 TaxID=3415683 RepID=UPI003CE56405
MALRTDQRKLRVELLKARKRLQQFAATLASNERQERRTDHRRLQREHDRLSFRRCRWEWGYRGQNYVLQPLIRGR